MPEEKAKSKAKGKKGETVAIAAPTDGIAVNTHAPVTQAGMSIIGDFPTAALHKGNRCEPDTVTILPAQYAISRGLQRSGAAVVSSWCPELSDGSDSAGNFAVCVEARQLGQRT